MSVNVIIKSIFDNKGIQQAQRQFAAIGKDIGRLAVGIGGGLTIGAVATAKFASSAIKAAEGVERANNRLAQVNESMGLFGSGTERVTQRLLAFAEAQEGVTAIDGELIKQSQAKLLTFKNLALSADEAGGTFDRATKATLDLAEVFQGDAPRAAVMLGKALENPTKGISALTRVGVTFTEQEKKTIAALVESGKMFEAQDIILQAIEKQVGGTAEATATASQKIQVAFENVRESTGAALLPAFEELADSLTTQVVPTLTDLATEVAPILVENIRLITEVLEQATSANTPLGRSVDGVADSFTLLFDTLAGGRSDLESTTDTLGMFADALNFIITTGAGFIAFLQVQSQFLAPGAILGNLGEFWKMLTTDPITYLQNQAKVRAEAAAVDAAFTDAAASARRMNDIDLARARAEVILTEKAVGSLKGALSASAGEANRFQNIMNGIKKAPPLDPIPDPKGTTKKDVETTKERFAKVQEVIKRAQKAILRAEQDYEKTRIQLNKDSEDRIDTIKKDAAAKRKQFVDENVGLLTNAFRSATQLSLGDLFNKKTETKLVSDVKRISENLTLTVTKEVEKTTFSSVQSIVDKLRERILASRRLLENASKLSAEGFSETFIQQVIETGAETGNELASAILEASPETRAEFRSLFNELETVSSSGMDSIAQDILNKSAVYQAALYDMSKALNESLEAEQDRLSKALSEAGLAFAESMKEIKATFLEDLGSFDGWFAGLKGTIDDLLDKMDALKGKGLADAQAAITMPNTGARLAGAAVTENVAIKNIQNAQGIVIDSMKDVAGTAAYLQARIAAANTYIRSSSSNAAQEASARLQISNFQNELANLRGAAATGTVTGTVININVKTDTTQSQAMVGKTIGNIVTKYVTTGGQVLVSGQ
jgi:hypothetical protein